VILLGKAKITITGTLTRAPKIRDNKTVDLMVNVDMSVTVPKGLKPLGKSICLVHVAPKTWKKVSDKVGENSFFIIQGEAKASVSQKKIPFIEVVALDIGIKEQNNKLQKKELIESIDKEEKKEIVESIDKEEKKEIVESIDKEEKKETVESIDKEEKKETIESKNEKSKVTKSKGKKKQALKTGLFDDWYKEEDVQYVSYEDIILREEIHFETQHLRLNGILKKVKEHNNTIARPLAVRKQENGKYSLVMGIANFMAAKVLEINKVPIVLKDMTYDEFVKKYSKNLITNSNGENLTANSSE
jgi:hypothetical protein